MIRVTWPFGSMRTKASGRSTYLAGACASARPIGKANNSPPPAARPTFRNSRRDVPVTVSACPMADIPNLFDFRTGDSYAFRRNCAKPGKIHALPVVRDRNRGSGVALGIWNVRERTVHAYRYRHTATAGGADFRNPDPDSAPAAQLPDRDLSDPGRARRAL